MRKAALLDWVDDQVDITGGEKHVLEKLARYADANDRAWAKVEQLAYETNVSVRTIQYRLRRLTETGKIAATGRFHRLGTRAVPIYLLAPERQPETTVEAAGKAAPDGPSMGADTAPMAKDGCNGLHPYGCNCLHPHKEPKLDPPSEADASSERARALEVRTMRAAFDEALATYPDSGRGVTSEPEAWALWREAAGEAGGPAVLAACVAAYGADPALKRRDFGAPSLQRFLREKRWRHWLPRASSAAGSTAPAANPFADPEIRAAFVAANGEGWVRAWLDKAAWRDGAIVAHLRVAADQIRRDGRRVLLELGVKVLDP